MQKNNEIIAAFFDDNLGRFSKNTVSTYKIALKQFFMFCQKEYFDINRRDIRFWLQALDDAKLKPKTIKLKIAAIRSFFNYCMEENLLEKNPTINVKSPRFNEPPPSYLTQKQLVRFRETTRNYLRDRVIIELLFVTGLRISELLSIKISDIKWDTGTIWVQSGKGESQRYVLFNTESAEWMKKYLAERNRESPYLFPNREGKSITRYWVAQKFNRYSKELGFKVTPHMLRHTFGSYMAEKEMRIEHIQRIMGHSNINSTRIYTRLKEEARKKLYDYYQ